MGERAGERSSERGVGGGLRMEGGGHTIVEAAGVPHPVVASGAAMKVHTVGAIKHVDAVIGVLAGVAVHNVNEHHQTKPVGLVNQGLQLIRCSKPAASLQDHNHLWTWSRIQVCYSLA